MVFKHFMFISFRASSWEDIILLSKTSTIGIARRKDEMTHFQNAVFEHLDCEKTGLICSIKQLRSVLKFCWRFLLEQRGFSSCISRVNSVGIVSFRKFRLYSIAYTIKAIKMNIIFKRTRTKQTFFVQMCKKTRKSRIRTYRLSGQNRPSKCVTMIKLRDEYKRLESQF